MMRGNLDATLTLLTLVVVSMLVVFLVVIGPARSSVHHATAKTLFWSSAYFLMIGVAFMFVEITLIQRMSLFLGHPIYGLAIVLFGIILATGSVACFPGRRSGSPPLARRVADRARGYLAYCPVVGGSCWIRPRTGSLIERATICLMTMLPAGVLMGFMFPTGMRLCTRIDPRITPWLWAVNGAAGVLATGSAVLVGIETSLNHALWVGRLATRYWRSWGCTLSRGLQPRNNRLERRIPRSRHEFSIGRQPLYGCLSECRWCCGKRAVTSVPQLRNTPPWACPPALCEYSRDWRNSTCRRLLMSCIPEVEHEQGEE